MNKLSSRILSYQFLDRVKYFALDYLGVAARGSLSESSRPVYRVVQQLDPSGTGTVVIGTDFRAGPPYAALANGIAAHSLELDDVVNAASLHPGVAIFSAAISAAKQPWTSIPSKTSAPRKSGI